MCGIVGYLGPRDPKNIIISGLKSLEYRGYDSAGVAILNGAEFKRVRAEGKLSNLEAKLQNEKFSGNCGIGHTRWATHGVPSERNAHPHSVDGISIIHNGIIENYLEIKEKLSSLGANFSSDTDSELVAHLIAREIKKTKDLYEAVKNVIPELKGAFSIVAVWDKQPNCMVAFKDGPPLVVGIGNKEHFICSDVQGFISYTNKAVYLNDLEVVVIKNETCSFYSANGFPIKKQFHTIDWSPELVEKQGYSHFMLKEIHEQPRAFAAAISPHLDLEKLEVNLQDIPLTLFKSIQRIVIVACGTSHYASLVGKYIIEQIAHVPVEIDIASEFRYRKPLLGKNDLFITISQSGETADTLAAIRLAKTLGAQTLSICNVKNSTIDREAHYKMYMNSGPEIGVASTKAFVSTLGLLNVLSLAIAQAKDVISNNELKNLIRTLQVVPSQIETVLNHDKYFADAANQLKSYRGFLYLGRGVNYPIALEGALKLKELAYMHAEGYAAGEMKHGPLALIDQRMAIVMIAPSDELYEKTLSNLEETKARGGQIISIGTGENEKLKSLSQRYLAIPKAHWTTNPILSVVPLQLMAFHLADSLGLDVDQPRNLAKSVTVE